MSKTNEIRQILMNELGLTREVIREEMQKIIEAEASKVMSILVSQGHLERIVRNKFDELVKYNRWTKGNQIMSIVTNAAETEAKRFVQENLRFSIAGIESKNDHRL